MATDGGNETDRCVVNVRVNDVNDNRPQFNCSDRAADEPYDPKDCFYSFEVSRDEVGSVVVDALHAVDNDTMTSKRDAQFKTVSFDPRNVSCSWNWTLNPVVKKLNICRDVDIAYFWYSNI